MKEKVIITRDLWDLNCLKKNSYTKDYKIISVDKTGRLNNAQIEEITKNEKIDELIMMFPTRQQQHSFYYKYRHVFTNLKLGFIHILYGETVEFTLRFKGDEFIKEILKSRKITKLYR